MKTGIGILDLYDDDSLKECLKNIPDNCYLTVVSNRKNGYKDEKINSYIKVEDVSLAHMRNLILHDCRIQNLDYYFILHSDQILTDSNIFENTINLSKKFGTWFLTGYVDDKTLDIEDDSGLTLKLSTKLNTKFLFTFKGIVKNVGFFDERYINSHDLDVIDYIVRLKQKKLYVSDGFYPTISTEIKENKKSIENPYIQDYPSEELSVRHSYGYFMHKNHYIPNHSDPKPKPQDEVLTSVEFLQQNYAKK
jgi:hypothetical protein